MPIGNLSGLHFCTTVSCKFNKHLISITLKYYMELCIHSVNAIVYLQYFMDLFGSMAESYSTVMTVWFGRGNFGE